MTGVSWADFMKVPEYVDEVPWNTQQTFAGVLFTLLPWLIFSLLLTVGAGLVPGAPTTSQPKVFSLQQDILNAVVGLIVGALSEGFFLVAPLYFARRATRWSHSETARRRTILDTLGFRRFDILLSLILVFVFFLGMIAVNVLYSILITKFQLHIQTNDQVVLERGRVLPITTYVTLALAVFIAPTCEEVFFRSFTFMGLRRGMPLPLAVTVSALIFGVAHADPASFPILFVIGIALAIVRWRTRSIWPGILLHTLNNATSALLIIVTLHGVQV
jgi:membrane protease YdiL (CAAX protease family)